MYIRDKICFIMYHRSDVSPKTTTVRLKAKQVKAFYITLLSKNQVLKPSDRWEKPPKSQAKA